MAAPGAMMMAVMVEEGKTSFAVDGEAYLENSISTRSLVSNCG